MLGTFSTGTKLWPKAKKLYRDPRWYFHYIEWLHLCRPLQYSTAWYCGSFTTDRDSILKQRLSLVCCLLHKMQIAFYDKSSLYHPSPSVYPLLFSPHWSERVFNPPCRSRICITNKYTMLYYMIDIIVILEPCFQAVTMPSVVANVNFCQNIQSCVRTICSNIFRIVFLALPFPSYTVGNLLPFAVLLWELLIYLRFFAAFRSHSIFAQQLVRQKHSSLHFIP